MSVTRHTFDLSSRPDGLALDWTSFADRKISYPGIMLLYLFSQVQENYNLETTGQLLIQFLTCSNAF